jgi:hypothetical protein
MPCNCDHLEPSSYEKQISKVACLLDELNGKKDLDRSHWGGMHPKVYSKCTKELADKMTAELCSRLQNTDVTKHSLEMQMWWRDHQLADKQRIERELQEKKNDHDRKAAIAKLTPHERQLLGLK